MEQQPVRRIPVGVVAGVSALVLAAGGGTAWWAFNSTQSSTTSSTPKAAQQLQPQAAQPANEQTVQIYWLKSTDNAIALAPTATKLESSTKAETIAAAFDRLLSGPTDTTLTTTIPPGTKLRQLTVRDDGIHVDLSEEFRSGGGSASMTGRLAQVLYTATSLDPNAQVWISVAGKPLETLGGEGLLIDQPLTRQNFEKNFTL